MSYNWWVQISTVPGMNAFPAPVMIRGQEISTADYYWEGKKREGAVGRCGFQLTVEGEGVFCDRNSVNRVSAGSGFLWEVNDPETVYFYPPGASGPWCIIFISFFNCAHMVRDMVSRFGHVYNLGTGNPAVMKLLSYKRYDGSVLEFSVSDSLALMSNLFSELLKTGTEKTSLTPGSLIVRKAVKYIFEHINENFNVRDIAEHTGVSPEHFSRVFKAETGLTPMDYLAREKMEHACEMLKGTNFSCKEIRARLGYDNSSHFARAFRRVTGFSPNEYRKRGIFSGINEKDL